MPCLCSCITFSVFARPFADDDDCFLEDVFLAIGPHLLDTRGGITFSQDEHSAKSGGMPHSAIATGAVDFVLPPARIAQELTKVESNPYLTLPQEQLDEPVVPGETDGELQRILDLVQHATSVDFSQYKQSTIRRRIGRRLVVHHLSTLGPVPGGQAIDGPPCRQLIDSRVVG